MKLSLSFHSNVVYPYLYAWNVFWIYLADLDFQFTVQWQWAIQRTRRISSEREKKKTWTKTVNNTALKHWRDWHIKYGMVLCHCNNNIKYINNNIENSVSGPPKKYIYISVSVLDKCAMYHSDRTFKSAIFLGGFTYNETITHLFFTIPHTPWAKIKYWSQLETKDLTKRW